MEQLSATCLDCARTSPVCTQQSGRAFLRCWSSAPPGQGPRSKPKASEVLGWGHGPPDRLQEKGLLPVGCRSLAKLPQGLGLLAEPCCYLGASPCPRVLAAAPSSPLWSLALCSAPTPHPHGEPLPSSCPLARFTTPTSTSAAQREVCIQCTTHMQTNSVCSQALLAPPGPRCRAADTHPPRPGFARVALPAQRCPCRWLAVAWMRLAQKRKLKSPTKKPLIAHICMWRKDFIMEN